MNFIKILRENIRKLQGRVQKRIEVLKGLENFGMFLYLYLYLVFSVGNMKEIFHSVDENKDGRGTQGNCKEC